MNYNDMFDYASEQKQKDKKIIIYSAILIFINAVLTGIAYEFFFYGLEYLLTKIFIFTVFFMIFTQKLNSIFKCFPSKTKNTKVSNKTWIKTNIVLFIIYLIPVFFHVFLISIFDWSSISDDYKTVYITVVLVTLFFALISLYILCRILYVPFIMNRNFSMKTSIVQSWKLTKGKDYLLKALKHYIFPLILMDVFMIVIKTIINLPLFGGFSFFIGEFITVLIPLTVLFVLFGFFRKGILFYHSYISNNTN